MMVAEKGKQGQAPPEGERADDDDENDERRNDER